MKPWDMIEMANEVHQEGMDFEQILVKLKMAVHERRIQELNATHMVYLNNYDNPLEIKRLANEEITANNKDLRDRGITGKIKLDLV